MRGFPDKIRLDFILFLFMTLVVLLTSLHPIPTADLWMFLSMGKNLTLTHQFPRVNFFSYTAPDFPVIDHEWIPELLFYHFHQAGGFTLLYVFKSAVILAVFLILFKTARKRGIERIFCICAVLLCAPIAKGNLYFDIRPYLFTYLFLSLLLFMLEEFSRGKRSVLYLFPLMSWIWVNSHGAFVIYFVVIILFMAAGLLQNFRKAPVPWAQIKPLSLVLVASLLLSFLNPYSVRLLIYPFTFIGPSIYRANLIEWVKPDYGGADLPFTIFFLCVMSLALIFRKKLLIFDMLCLLFFGYLAITTVRHITLFCMICIPVMAVILRELYLLFNGPLIRQKLQGLNRTIWAALKVLLLVFFILVACLSLRPVDLANLNMEKSLFPRYGVDFIRANNLPPPLFNPYEWGGYLLWRLYPDYRVFVDGRINNAYPEQVYRDCLTVMFGKAGWQDVLARYHINTVLCNKYFINRAGGDWIGFRLAGSPQWKLIYEDRIEQIYLRRCPENVDLIKKAESGKLLFPVSPWILHGKARESMSRGELEAARGYLERALVMDPTFTELYADLGFIYCTMGQYRQARKIVSMGIRRDPSLYLTHYCMGIICEKEGNIALALKEYRKALKLNPHDKGSQEALRRIESRTPK